MNPDKKPQKVKDMFNKIAKNYDKMNNFISFFSHFLIKTSAINTLKIKKGSTILDLCCGTGDITSIISKKIPNSKVIGLDFSSEMIKIAKNKYKKNIFIKGDATNLPFKNEEFDYVICAFGLRNIEDQTKALSEIYRVLKYEGKFLHLDFTRNKFYEKIFAIWVNFCIRLQNADYTAYKYLLASIKTFQNSEELIKIFQKAGLHFIEKRNYIGVETQIMEK